MVYISSHNHALGLFKNGEYYYFFDSNDGEECKTKSLITLAKLIFQACNFYRSTPSPISFKMFSFDDQPKHTYPSQQEVLVRLKPSLNLEEYAICLFGKQFSTGLIFAVRRKSLESVEYFLETDIDVNLKGTLDQSALIEAVIGNSIEIVNLLLEKGKNIDVNTQDNKNDTALIKAAKYGYTNIVELLLEKGKNIDLNVKDHLGYTALQRAKNSEIAEMIKKKADSLGEVCVDPIL